MNLGIEYLVRSKLGEKLLELPCSFFLISRMNKSKLVITLNGSNGNYVVKHWQLSQCDKNSALPPMEEFIVNNPFYSNKVVVPHYRLFKYQEQPIPTGRNNWRFPMSKTDYESYYDNFLCSSKHITAREFWLWNTFVKVYEPELAQTSFSSHGSFDKYRNRSLIYTMQMHHIMDNCQRTWKYWPMWKRHLLECDNIPGELIFSHLY